MKKYLSEIICILLFIIVALVAFYFKMQKHPDVEINTINVINEYVNKDTDEIENPFSSI